MRILFVTHPYPNYVPDLLLHGLRKLLGPAVVDFPKKECLYQGVIGLGVCSDDQLSPGWFPDDNDQIDREDIWQKLRHRYFDYLICDCRSVSDISQQHLPADLKLVLIDGEDRPARISPGKYIICRRETDGSDFSIPLPMALPEELLHWIKEYDDFPKEYSVGFLGSVSDDGRKKILEFLANYYPDTLFSTTLVPSESSPRPAGRFSRDEYYRMLQKCRIVLSLAGEGNDTFRFWENAACNAIHVSAQSPLYIPDDFVEAEHIFRFQHVDDLRKAIDAVLEDKLDTSFIVANGRQHLNNHHLTTGRATYFIDRMKSAFES